MRESGETRALRKRATWDYRLVPHVDSIGDARRHTRHVLAEHTDPDTLDCVELVVSELVTNAVRHGPGKLITLRLVTGDDGSVTGEILDQGIGAVAVREPVVGEAGGLGLSIVDALTSEWGVHPDSSHVWFRFAA